MAAVVLLLMDAFVVVSGLACAVPRAAGTVYEFGTESGQAFLPFPPGLPAWNYL
jgi:hypothetical protein